VTARRLLAAVGAAGVLSGGALLVAPGLGPSGLDPVLPVLAVAGGALLVTGLAAATGLAAGTDAVAPRRDPHANRVPGDGFDDALAAVSATGRRAPGEHREAVRERLATAAVALLVERRELSPEVARRRLSTGTWTDDPVAAAFFAEDTPALSTVDHLRLLAGGELPFRRRARRAVAAMDALAEEGPNGSVERGAGDGGHGEGATGGGGHAGDVTDRGATASEDPAGEARG
jgi:hypothetical protein